VQTLIRHLDWQAIFVGFVGGYAVPVLLACFMTGGAWLLWFWIAAPVIGGYLAARMAAKLPLMHGLAVALLGLLVFGLISSSRPLEGWILWIAITIGCSIFGASIWRRTARRLG
jgi:hypothetical protein